MTLGQTFIHYGVEWTVERITPEWVYCRPKKVGRHQWRKFLEEDGTMEWCRKAVLKAIKSFERQSLTH